MLAEIPSLCYYLYNMITASKAITHVVHARKWENGFMTRPNMRKKWRRGSTNSECGAGLWELQRSGTIRNHRSQKPSHTSCMHVSGRMDL